MGKKYWVFTDFDGTVTLDDNQVQILDAFAVKNWREIEYRICSVLSDQRVTFGDC